jgi:hypothetical protein
MPGEDVIEALDALAALGTGAQLSQTIRALENSLVSKRRTSVQRVTAQAGVDENVLRGALAIKQIAGQINVIVHVAGILTALPYVLRKDERIESLSLGAGNTGRTHDLETDRQIAEFKFIAWQGGAETIRQNSLFIDIFNLASAETSKRRRMYVLGRDHPEHFLKGGRAIRSVLSRNSGVAKRFAALHGDRFRTVAEYFASVDDKVEIVDLRDVVPAFGSSAA